MKALIALPVVLLVALLVTAAPLTADVTYPDGRAVECYCTDKTGARVELGVSICLDVGGRRFMARCEMSLNNPMWRETGEGCLSSRALPQSVPELGQPAGDAGAVDAQI